MNKLTTARLIEAAKRIAQYENAEISMIQFEDGSGNNFNYTVAHTGKTKFTSWDALDIALSGKKPKTRTIWDSSISAWVTISDAKIDELIEQAFNDIEKKKK